MIFQVRSRRVECFINAGCAGRFSYMNFSDAVQNDSWLNEWDAYINYFKMAALFECLMKYSS